MTAIFLSQLSLLWVGTVQNNLALSCKDLEKGFLEYFQKKT